MTRVAILPVPSKRGGIEFCAVSGERRSQGSTAGEAFDALAAQLPSTDSSTLVLVQAFRPDRFFDARQREQLCELMQRWRAARDAGQPFAEQAELDALIDAELRAAGARAAHLADESGL